MIETYPGFTAPIERLFELANTSCEQVAFKSACDRFAVFEPALSGEWILGFSLVNDGEPFLLVCLPPDSSHDHADGHPEIECAILSFAWWETFSRAEHPSTESWEHERAEFDRVYTEALMRTAEVLGPPLMQGQDVDEARHRHAIWRGETGLLVLQQSAFDVQFGLDVAYWVVPWKGADPRPESPFVDWLMRQVRSRTGPG